MSKHWWRRLFLVPSVLVPLAVGLGSFAWGLVAGSSAVTTTVGIAGVVLGVGAAAYRAITKGDRLSKKAERDAADERAEGELEAFDRLEHRLYNDDDPNTTAMARKLRELYERIRKVPLTSSETSAEVRKRALRLCLSCRTSLERTVELYEASERMATEETRAETLRSREELLGEIRASMEKLGATLDEIESTRLEKRVPESGSEALARARLELDEGLAVARRVEERMEEFHRRFDRTAGRE